MKDSQPEIKRHREAAKYIKANNERFSTRATARAEPE